MKKARIILDLAEANEKNKILAMPTDNPNFEIAMDKIASTIKIKA